MDYDVIIIGAGLGGLTAAATLAQKGKKVIVIVGIFQSFIECQAIYWMNYQKDRQP